MQVKQEQLSPCDVELEVEIDADQVASAFEDAYRELGQGAEIAGFRKGKAPRQVLEAHLDRDKVRTHVADKLVQPAYAQALKDSELDPFAPADVRLVKFEQGEPLVFKAKVPLAPKVELGDYVGLEIERRVTAITDEEVDGEVRRFVERAATFTPVTDRGVQQGDFIVFDLKDERNPENEGKRQEAEVGVNLADFDNGVVEMQPGEEKVIEVTYPKDHPDEQLRGATVPLRVKLEQILLRELPELNDEWVREQFADEPKEGEEAKEPNPNAVDTVDKLRGRVRGALENMAQEVANEEVEESIVKRVAEGAKVCFPDVMVEEEVGERIVRLREELKKRKLTLEDYLKHTERTFEQLRADYEEAARNQLTRQLVLREIVENEGIKVEEEDVSAEVRSMAERRGVPPATIEAYLDRTDSRESVRARVLYKKLVDFLVHASNIKTVGR